MNRFDITLQHMSSNWIEEDKWEREVGSFWIAISYLRYDNSIQVDSDEWFQQN